MNRYPTLTCLCVALALVSLAPRSAQAQYASEPTQILNMGQLIDQTAKLGDQFKKLEEQYDKLKEQYDQLNLGSFELPNVTGFRENNSEFKTRSESYGIERCKVGKSPVGEDQKKLCEKIVLMENKRFNVMAEMLNDVQKRDNEIRRLMQDRKSIDPASGKGKLDANTNAVTALQAQMENDIQNASRTLEAYDIALKSLNGEMVALARNALLNKAKEDGLFKRVANKVVPGLALKGALAGARQREL